MTFKNSFQNPLFQYGLEIALPVIGYLFLGWTLPVIITFYFFDFLGSEFARHRRHHAVLKVNSAASKNKWFIGIIVSVLVLIVTAGYATYIFSTITASELKPILEISEFLKSEGWILLPLVLFAAHLKDKMTFYLPKKFYDYSFDILMKKFFIEIAILLVLIVTGLFGYTYLFKAIDGLLLLGSFILVKLAFDFLLKKRLDESARN